MWGQVADRHSLMTGYKERANLQQRLSWRPFTRVFNESHLHKALETCRPAERMTKSEWILRQEDIDKIKGRKTIGLKTCYRNTVKLTTWLYPLVVEAGSCSWTSTSALWNIVLNVTGLENVLIVYMQWLPKNKWQSSRPTLHNTSLLCLSLCFDTTQTSLHLSVSSCVRCSPRCLRWLTSSGGGQTWAVGARPARWRWCRRPRYHTGDCSRPSSPLQPPLEPSWGRRTRKMRHVRRRGTSDMTLCSTSDMKHVYLLMNWV